MQFLILNHKLYFKTISGLCESKPTTVKCCFSLGGSGSVSCSSPTQKLSHSTGLSYIQSAGISISSSGGCSDRNKPTCTSLDQVNCKTIAEIVNYRKISNCATTITGIIHAKPELINTKLIYFKLHSFLT